MMNFIKLITIQFIFLPTLVYSQTCLQSVERTTPDSRFEIINNGSEVKDSKTNLIWRRCSIGQQWNGVTCAGQASSIAWEDALIEAKSIGNNYRLPNIRELTSIVERGCDKPAINTTIFPNVRYGDNSWGYWTSSVEISMGGLYIVNFSNGMTNIVHQGIDFSIPSALLVREE